MSNLYCARLGVVNFNDKILSPGSLVEIEANLHKVSEIERGCQGSKGRKIQRIFRLRGEGACDRTDSKDVGKNSQDLSGRSITTITSVQTLHRDLWGFLRKREDYLVPSEEPRLAPQKCISEMEKLHETLAKHWKNLGPDFEQLISKTTGDVKKALEREYSMICSDFKLANIHCSNFRSYLATTMNLENLFKEFRATKKDHSELTPSKLKQTLLHSSPLNLPQQNLFFLEFYFAFRFEVLSLTPLENSQKADLEADLQIVKEMRKVQSACTSLIRKMDSFQDPADDNTGIEKYESSSSDETFSKVYSCIERYSILESQIPKFEDKVPASLKREIGQLKFLFSNLVSTERNCLSWIQHSKLLKDIHDNCKAAETDKDVNLASLDNLKAKIEHVFSMSSKLTTPQILFLTKIYFSLDSAIKQKKSNHLLYDDAASSFSSSAVQKPCPQENKCDDEEFVEREIIDRESLAAETLDL